MSTVQKKEECLQSVCQLGDTIRINADVFQKIAKLSCHLYRMPDEPNIKETRYRKFCIENTPESHQLPRTKVELTQHTIRANYQAYVWKRALETNLDISSLIGHGWERENDELSVVWLENQPAPESVLEFLTCACRKSNCTNSCQCRVLSMECTDVCKYRGLCGNIIYESVASDNDEVEEDNENNNANDDA